MQENIFINIKKEDYKKLVGIDKTNPNYYKVAFIDDGSGIVTRGKLFGSSPYLLKFIDLKDLPEASKQEDNTIYMVVDQ